uniref:Ig-like domain-containing protein n=1 Tax=Takifugu rubripes TaxID=31033 RepID=A0A674NG22_TAKRU
MLAQRIIGDIIRGFLPSTKTITSGSHKPPDPIRSSLETCFTSSEGRGVATASPFWEDCDTGHTSVYYVNGKQRGYVSIGNATDVSLAGSLLLKDLQLSSSGDYRVIVLHPNNTQAAAAWSRRVCVLDSVPKPDLSYLCDFSASSVTLNCHVAKARGVEFSWVVDGKFSTAKTQTLSVSLAKVKVGMSFVCSVANIVSRESSGTVRPLCQRSPPTPSGPYCFSLKTVQAVFAGGVGLLVLLLSIIVILCCRRMRDLRKAQEENYEVMLSPKEPQLQNSEHCYLTVPQPEDPTPNRLPPCPGEGQRASPVPKPRTKSPRTRQRPKLTSQCHPLSAPAL